MRAVRFAPAWIFLHCLALLVADAADIDAEALRTIDKIEAWGKAHPDYILRIVTKSNERDSVEQTFIKTAKSKQTKSSEWVMITDVKVPRNYRVITFQSPEGDIYFHLPETGRLVLQKPAYELEAQIGLLTGRINDEQGIYQAIKSNGDGTLEGVILVFNCDLLKTAKLLPRPYDQVATQIFCDDSGQIKSVINLANDLVSQSEVKLVTSDEKTTRDKLRAVTDDLPPLSSAKRDMSMSQAVDELINKRSITL